MAKIEDNFETFAEGTYDSIRRPIWTKYNGRWHFTTHYKWQRSIVAQYINTKDGRKQRVLYQRWIHYLFCGLSKTVYREQDMPHLEQFAPPEGEVCPICLAYYEGIRYTMNKLRKRKKTLKQIEKEKLPKGEVPWYDQ